MKKKGVHTHCIHTGEINDTQFGGAVSPIFMSSSYPFMDVEKKGTQGILIRQIRK